MVLGPDSDASLVFTGDRGKIYPDSDILCFLCFSQSAFALMNNLGPDVLGIVECADGLL